MAHLAVIFPQRVFIAVIRRPDELERGAEALVSECHGRVDDVLAIAANDDESAVGIVPHALRVQVGGA